MTNTDSNRSAQQQALERIAKARAARPEVDHNGQVTSKPRTFHYVDGLLESTTDDDAA